MNSINLKTFSTAEITEQIGRLFSVSIDASCSSNSILLPEEAGGGKITTIDFDNGTNLILFDIELKNTLTINFGKEHVNPLNFLHCNKGSIVHKLCDSSIHYELESMKSSITSCPKDAEQSLIFPKEEQVIISMISVDRERYTDLSNCHPNDDIPQEFVDTINDYKGCKTFYYRGNSDYQLSKSLKALFASDLEGLEDFVFAESDMLEALGHFIRNYKENQNPKHEQLGLCQYDIDCLNKAKDIIITSLNNSPTIPELAKLVGINQQKLKKGFKIVYGKTINQFLIQKRMEAAKILLTQNGNSIREVASQVGYSNQSHFSSKFRDHFGMLPKDFVKSVDVGHLRASMN